MVYFSGTDCGDWSRRLRSFGTFGTFRGRQSRPPPRRRPLTIGTTILDDKCSVWAVREGISSKPTASRSPLRSVRMRRYCQPLLFALLLVVLLAPANIVAHKKRSSHQDIRELTNAERFARGLPPATPRRLHDPDRVRVRDSTPSSFPVCGGCNIGTTACDQKFAIEVGMRDFPRSIGYLTWNEDDESWVVVGNIPYPLSSSGSAPFSVWGLTSGGGSVYLQLFCPDSGNLCGPTSVPTDERIGLVTGTYYSTSTQERQTYVWSTGQDGILTATRSQADGDYTVDFYVSANHQAVYFALSPSADWVAENQSTSSYIPVILRILDLCGSKR